MPVLRAKAEEGTDKAEGRIYQGSKKVDALRLSAPYT